MTRWNVAAVVFVCALLGAERAYANPVRLVTTQFFFVTFFLPFYVWAFLEMADWRAFMVSPYSRDFSRLLTLGGVVVYGSAMVVFVPIALLLGLLFMLIAGVLMIAVAVPLAFRKGHRAGLRAFRVFAGGLAILMGIPLAVAVLRIDTQPESRLERVAKAHEARTVIVAIGLGLRGPIARTPTGNANELFFSGEREGETGPYTNGVLGYLGYDRGEFTMEQMAKAQALYTRTLHAVCWQGSGALSITDDELGIPYAAVLNTDLVGKLRAKAPPAPEDADRLYLDPWGNPYQIWPGPWPAGVTNRFRVYGKASPAASAETAARQLELDALSRNTPGSRREYRDIPRRKTKAEGPFGYAAPRDLPFFIWSYGWNMANGQLVYVNEPARGHAASGQVDNPSRWGYTRKSQKPEFFGGGDDINSWDGGESWWALY